jgi:formaldehyde-activating enzyme
MAKVNGLCVGESLVGEGNEVAHIDLLMGPRGSAAETAFANALTNQKAGFTSLLAVIAPNLLCKPPTILFNKVTIKGAKQAVQMFGPAQHAVAKAVADSVAEGHSPRRSRQSLHLRWRVHPLGSRRRQEDPGLQLSRHQGSDRASRQRRAEGVRSGRQAQPGQAPIRRLAMR